jgi:hypothetical protein
VKTTAATPSLRSNKRKKRKEKRSNALLPPSSLSLGCSNCWAQAAARQVGERHDGLVDTAVDGTHVALGLMQGRSKNLIIEYPNKIANIFLSHIIWFSMVWLHLLYQVHLNNDWFFLATPSRFKLFSSLTFCVIFNQFVLFKTVIQICKIIGYILTFFSNKINHNKIYDF